jgi:agmatine deiminase
MLYFSSLIKSAEYQQDFHNIQVVLEKHSIEFQFLENTNDIWCRDYMPVKRPDGKFVQFVYQPSYLDETPELRTEPSLVTSALGLNAINCPLNVDGGNIERLGNTVVMTDRVFDENNDFDKMEIHQMLEEVMQSKVYFMKAYDKSTDFTGHIDGMMRFKDDNTLLGNDPSSDFKYIQQGVQKLLDQTQLNYVDVPYFVPKKKESEDSAIGIYINYLKVNNLILIPKFEVEGNKDKEAYLFFKRQFPSYEIEAVNINNIAKRGGMFNCISWEL